MESLALSAAFWRGRRVLVTGVTGFKGSWLTLWLRDLGATVVGYSLPPPTNPSLFRIAGIGDMADYFDGDVRDRAQLRHVIDRGAPEVVFHLAAQPIVRVSYESPVETFETNVLGTVNLLDALREQPATRAIVVVTTDKCYENREWRWPYRETDALGGHDPYSGSKACAEIVAATFYRSFFASRGIGVATVRAGNVVGGGDWAHDRLIPDAMRSLAAGESVLVRNPASVRPWQHVLEPIHGYLALAERLANEADEYSEAWNFGPEAEAVRSVSELIDAACSLWGQGARWHASSGLTQPHEAKFLALDSSKARARLGWQPRLRLLDALDWSVAWYKAYRSGNDMRDFSLRQIRRYSALHSPTALLGLKIGPQGALSSCDLKSS